MSDEKPPPDGRVLAVYSRVSTDKQEKGLEAQQRALREYVDYVKAEGVLHFSDEAISGMKRSRPGFDLMMKAVREGRVHTVIVYSFSRFARNTRHLIESLEEFNQRKVAFVSLSEKIDTSGPMGKFLFTIFAGLAQFERDTLAERTKLGLKNARAKGVVLGRRKKDRNEAQILQLVADGVPVLEVARTLGVSRGAVYRTIRGAKTHAA